MTDRTDRAAQCAERATDGRPATMPPRNEAISAVTPTQIAADIEKVEALGLSDRLAASSDDARIPMSSKFYRTCTTAAVVTPAKIAPQDTRLPKWVRVSTAGFAVDRS